MSLSRDDRTHAIFEAVKASNPNFSQLSGAESDQLKAGIAAMFGADLDYLVANTTVNPATMQAPAGAAVATTGGPAAQSGTVTSPVGITGTGTIS